MNTNQLSTLSREDAKKKPRTQDLCVLAPLRLCVKPISDQNSENVGT